MQGLDRHEEPLPSHVANAASGHKVSKMIERDRVRVSSQVVPAGAWALALRAIVGYGFMAHGFAKLVRGPSAFAGILHAMGVPFPDLMAWVTIGVELAGGFAVLIGAFLWTVSVPMIVILLVAMFTVHLPYGFSSVKLVAVTSAGAQFGPPGYEVDLLYIACLLALVVGGAGPLSIDMLIARRSSRERSLPRSGERVPS